MRTILVLTAILFSFSSAYASEIREFSVPTLERLGNELSRRDAIAERASEIVLRTQPAARALKARGWITELRANGDIVYFIAETPSGLRLSYTVTFHPSVKPEVQDVRGQPLPPDVAIRYKALETALKALKGHLFNLSYNYEVLNDPDGSGFLVYALGDTGKPGDVVVCGHLRVTVSADGERAERVDALSKSLIVENRNRDPSPRGYSRVAMVVSSMVSDKPVETFIYASNLLKLKMVIATPPNGQIWFIEDGKITRDKKKSTPRPK